MRVLSFVCAVLLGPALVSRAGVVAFEGDSFPDSVGWQREPFGTPDRTLQDGIFIQQFDQPPDQDFYRRSVADFSAVTSFFMEWSMRSNAPASLLDASQTPAALALYGNGVALYHTTITSSRVQFLRDTFVPLVFAEIDPATFHTYRLELFGTEKYRFIIDGELIDAGKPLGPLPTLASGLVWGARYYAPGHTVEWDYIRYGTVPEPATLSFIAVGAALLFRRRLWVGGRGWVK